MRSAFNYLPIKTIELSPFLLKNNGVIYCHFFLI